MGGTRELFKVQEAPSGKRGKSVRRPGNTKSVLPKVPKAARGERAMKG